jgi:hypothetical protein
MVGAYTHKKEHLHVSRSVYLLKRTSEQLHKKGRLHMKHNGKTQSEQKRTL